MTAGSGNARRRKPDSQPPITDDPAAFPQADDQRGVGRSPATAATVGLATAARLLGLSRATALALAEDEQFPCNVIKTTTGFRVPFASLVRVLRSSRNQRGQNARDDHHSPDERR
jgi:hypothetical protein